MKNKIVPACVFLSLILSGCATVPYQPPAAIEVPKPLTGGIYHDVIKGETLWQISKTYGVDLSDIVRVNNLSDATKISSGQKLFIPGAKSPVSEIVREKKLYEKDVFVWPIQGDIISYFGQESYGARNKGIDIQAREGADIVASKGGKVIFCDDKVSGLGKTIIIDHMDGFFTVYARNSHNLVKAGDYVNQNQAIASIGSGGRGKGAYLHFEIRRRNKSQNPLYYLP